MRRKADSDHGRRALRAYEGRDGTPSSTAAAAAEDAAASAIDGTLAVRADGSPRVPAFLFAVMEDVVATGNNRRLVRCVEGTTALEERTVRDDFLQALLLFVAAPPQKPSPEGVERSPASSPTIRVDAPLAEPLVSSAWMDAEEQSGATAVFHAAGLSASLSAFPSTYRLLDEPSFDAVLATPIPFFDSLPTPHLFPAVVVPTLQRLPPSLTPLSSPWVDPLIQRLQALADPQLSEAPLPAPLSALPVASSHAEWASDSPLSSLVESALSDGSFSPPAAVPLLSLALLQPLNARFLASCRQLHSALLERCGLLGCLSALRDFFFAAHGLLIDDFVGLFRSTALSTALINERLSEALSSAGKTALIGRLRAVHGEKASFSSISSSFSSSSVSLLLSLHFHYEVAWPLSEVVTAEHVRRYNQVLHLILHLRVSLRALSRLSQLSARQSTASSHPLAHQFHLFRAAVHHCVRVLHDYVITHATLSAWPTLVAAMQAQPSSASLARLRAHHSAYLERILHLCLLTPNLSAAFAALQKMVGGVGAVEGLGRIILQDYLAHSIDDWAEAQPHGDEEGEEEQWIREEEEEDERGLREERRRRMKAWRLSLSEEQQRALQRRYGVYRDELLSECWHRLEEQRTAHQRNLRFLLLVLEQISSHGVHPHRQRTREHTHHHGKPSFLASPLTHLVPPSLCL